MKNKEKNPMLKLLQTTALLFFTASLAGSASFYPEEFSGKTRR